MKPTPPGWPRISSALFYEDPKAAIDWLERTFGFETRLRVEGENGRIEHCELVFGDGMIMIGTSGGGGRPEDKFMVSPRVTGGGNTQSLCVFVDDVEAHYGHAKAAGARIFRELATSDYGEEYWVDRGYGALDLEGHHWWFMQRLR